MSVLPWELTIGGDVPACNLKMIDKNKELRISGEKLLTVLRDVEYMLISLHKIGSYYAPDLPGVASEYCSETTRFVDDGEVPRRLAEIRTILSEAFDGTR
jgi:hypothetical protein